MGDFKISGKNVITQAGTAEPVLASNVTLGTGIITPANIQDAATSTLSCTTNSTTTVTTADTSSLSVGMAVSGTGIPAGATIVTVPNSTSFTLSAAATASATNTLTFQKGIISTKIEDDAITGAKIENNPTIAGNLTTVGSILPSADDAVDLGSATKQWRNIYTGDLHLTNERGSWTVIEEEDYLTLRNNKTDKIYKLVMEEVE